MLEGSELDEKQFFAEVKLIASGLKSGEIDYLVKLRKLERQLEPIEFFEGWKNEDIKFLAYFIKHILGIVWRNFAVDSPVDLADWQLKELATYIGSFLIQLIKLMEEDNVGKGYKTLSFFTNEIFLKIIQVNKMLFEGAYRNGNI
jgi:hypothetical protein